MLTYEGIVSWLKSSILGIIILGALGSILAIFMLRFLKWLVRRYALTCLASYAARNVRPYILASVMTTRLIRMKETEKLIFYSLYSAVSFMFNTVIMEVLIIATVYVFIKYGTTLGNLQIVMVALTFIAANCWVREMFSFSGITRVLLYDDYLEVTKKLKDILKTPRNVFDMAKVITEMNLDQVVPKSAPPGSKAPNTGKPDDAAKSTENIENHPKQSD